MKLLYVISSHVTFDVLLCRANSESVECTIAGELIPSYHRLRLPLTTLTDIMYCSSIVAATKQLLGEPNPFI